MAPAHLIAFCKEAVCVAEDSSVAFFAPKNLKKFRVERLGGRRVVGLYAVTTATGDTHLHVVDAEANWFVLSLAHIELLASSSIRWGTAAAAAAAAAAEVHNKKPVISARRTDSSVAERDRGVLEAHFHEAGGELHCVLLTLSGAHEASLRDPAAVRANRIMTFAGTLQDCTMAVGRTSGLVLVAQRGGRWAQYSLFAERDAPIAPQLDAPIGVQSIACSPTTLGVAFGGTRGELVVFPSVTKKHHFAEHWHHTPLTALSFAADGLSLFTGGRESVMLVWSLSSYAFKKIGCSLGPIHSIVPAKDTGARLLLTCAESTLATLDLLQMRVERSIEGVQWSVGEACTGLVATRWMGQPAVVLTGLPHVVRVCDPLTQQSLYSLYISAQMETVANPPRHGIQHVGILRDSSIIVTYEEFGGTTLPALLRFWTHDASARRHVESQSIYSPHCGAVLALEVDNSRRRVFTLSADTIKCWGERREDANDALATAHTGWANVSATATPSRLVQDMTLSADGSLCFVADDCVHVYAVAHVQVGAAWCRLLTLTQSAALAPLRDLQLLDEARVVVARDAARVYLWSLTAPEKKAVVWDADKGATVTALCAFRRDTVLAATDRGDLCEISCAAAHKNTAQDSMGRELGRATGAAAHRITHMKRLPGTDDSVAVVDDASGFVVLHVAIARHEVHVAQFTKAERPAADADEEKGQLQHFFHDISGSGGNDASGDETVLSLREAARAAEAKKWLLDVLADSAYTAPPMRSVLSSYLRKRAGILTA